MPAKKKQPKLDLPKLITHWAERQLPKSELCSILGISTDTFDRRDDLRQLYAKAKDSGKAYLRGRLYEQARNSQNPAFLIFALKNWCGLSDKQNIELSGQVQLSNDIDTTIDGLLAQLAPGGQVPAPVEATGPSEPADTSR